jgi:hypothetical protein
MKLVQPKINFERVAFFQRRKTTIQKPAFHHQFTTTSPANYHTKKHTSPKTPSKNAHKLPNLANHHADIFSARNPKSHRPYPE